MEQLKIPGYETKRTYRFHIYYRYSYIGYRDVVTNCVDEEQSRRQAWAILYNVCPEIKTKSYKVTDFYRIK